MKKEKSSKRRQTDGEMRNEYDFRGGVRGKHYRAGVRGKHYRAYRSGHSVTIHKTDGATVVQHFALEDGAVVLEPDVQ